MMTIQQQHKLDKAIELLHEVCDDNDYIDSKIGDAVMDILEFVADNET